MSAHGYLRSLRAALILPAVAMLCLAWVAQPVAAQTDVSAVARASFDAGVAAARAQRWQDALVHFSDAEAADSISSDIWFNLALTLTNMPGAELRAIAWFRLFLHQRPDAANAGAIRNQITGLQQRHVERARTILATLEDIAGKTKAAEGFAAVAAGYLYYGDNDNARRVIAQAELMGDFWSAIRFEGSAYEFLQAVALAGDDGMIDSLMAALDRYPAGAVYRNILLADGIVPRRASRGQIERARDAAQFITDSVGRGKAWLSIACAEWTAGRSRDQVTPFLQQARAAVAARSRVTIWRFHPNPEMAPPAIPPYPDDRVLLDLMTFQRIIGAEPEAAITRGMLSPGLADDAGSSAASLPCTAPVATMPVIVRDYVTRGYRLGSRPDYDIQGFLDEISRTNIEANSVLNDLARMAVQQARANWSLAGGVR